MFDIPSREETQAIDSRLRELFQANVDLAREREKAHQPESAAEIAKVKKVGGTLRQWPDEVAAMPTELTRTSLFGLPRRGQRKVMNWEKLSSRQDIEVSYFGEQLDQADADIWLACLRMGRGIPMGQKIFATRAAILKGIGRNTSGASIKWLFESLKRLSGAAFEIVAKRSGKTIRVTTGMLKYGVVEETGQMFIRLDPDGAALFENLAYIGWEERLALGTNVAKSLQIYLTGHAQGLPHSVLVADLARWAGYSGRVRQYRKELSLALVELEKAGEIKDWKMTNGPRGDVVSWARSKK